MGGMNCSGMHHAGGMYGHMTGVPTNAQGAPETPNPSMAKILGSSSDHIRAAASALFQERCASCHGQDGHGDGPGALSLEPKPVNFHNPNWQHSVTDDQIAKAIVGGGQAVGLSKQMPDNPDLEDNPKEVKALVAYIRDLGSEQKGP
jgi:mono/diheme cytochrome c family protein